MSEKYICSPVLALKEKVFSCEKVSLNHHLEYLQLLLKSPLITL